MFDMPSLYGTKNYITEVPGFILTELKFQCTFSEYPCDKDVYDLCRIIAAENQYRCTYTDDPYSRIDLYINLRRIIKEVVG